MARAEAGVVRRVRNLGCGYWFTHDVIRVRIMYYVVFLWLFSEHYILRVHYYIRFRYIVKIESFSI